MPKKILYESAVHQFLWAGKRLRIRLEAAEPARVGTLSTWLNQLTIENPGAGQVRVAWPAPVAGEHFIALKNAKFYTRGDAKPHAQKQTDAGLTFSDDQVMAANLAFFDGELRLVLGRATVFPDADLARWFANAHLSDAQRKHAEEIFHDEWAASVDVTKIDVRKMNEACTAPEMRYIRQQLGNLKGKTLLDVGCGLGEASVYFAMEGATVTASDISPGMCDTAQRLAEANGVSIQTHVAAVEDMRLPAGKQFDIIYTGNTLHHADIPVMLDRILPHLKPDGVFVSWDPVAYNPVINVYRAMANEVRTEDEHPLRLRDVREVRTRFATSETRWFWLTTLLIFILMAVVQFRSPNKERYWKKVIEEADTWAWLYRPLAALDRALLAVLPFLRPLCWNVVIIARGPKPVGR
jgi:2-polyprenyl-3-methyl-5-hydroxy-6-metoxy-1,4-benzoquinol methylase